MTAKRNVGLDIVRISAMCGILVLHMLGQGGELAACDTGSVKYWVSYWIEICAYCAVDLFALLSGWLGIFKKKNSTYRTLELIAITVFYSVLITVVFLFAAPDVFNGFSDIIYSIVPAFADRYWYINCYIALAFLQPFINKILLSLTVKQHQMLCFISLILFSVIPSFVKTDFFAFENGYSFAWLLVCYILGAYLRRLKDDYLKWLYNIKGIAIFLTGSALLLFGNMLIYAVLGSNPLYMISYISPIVLLMSASFLISMKSLPFQKEKHMLKKLSEPAFDVYIIHCHMLVFDHVLTDRFSWLADMNVGLIVPLTLAIAVALYMGLSVVGMLRAFLFKCTRLNKLLYCIAVKIDKIIYKDLTEIEKT